MIDTGGGKEAWARLLESVLAERGIRIAHVLLTHWHGDHTGGVPDLLRLYPELKDSIYKNSPDLGQQDITDGQIWRVEGSTIRATHVPGHSHDHMCFILEEESAMFTGDNVLGTGTSAVEDLGTFMDSLRKMQHHKCAVGHPAHGTTIGNLPSKLKHELDQKLRRERQVLKALDAVQKLGQPGATIIELVTAIYGESLDEEVRTLALEPFTEEVVRKLAGDGEVGYRVTGGKRKWFSIKSPRL
jgi:glyoxylase-like metal-dependent hydrolase (beta-lactamase superfamily II)